MDLNETAQLASTVETMQRNLNDFFLVISAILVFAMQMGFSLMETGLVRSKNATTILMKSTLDAFIGSVAYWLIGYALAHGEGNDFVGWTGFALVGVNPSRLSFWFYQAIFANTASTITSGAVAERLHLSAFFIYSFCLTGVMYPIASRWVWFHNGWLKQQGFIDFGGSGVVHMIGGVCALVAALYVGPRTVPPNLKKKTHSLFRGHSMTLTGIGAFLLMFGIMGYNMSSQLKITRPGDGPVIALSAVNTLIAGSAGSFVALILGRTTPTGKYRWSYMTMLNGSIAGMVSACAGCNAMPVWGAFITGTGAGLVFFALRTLLHKCAVDDALDSFAVHFGGGFFGMMTAPIFIEKGVLLTGDAHSAKVLAFQVAGILVLISWSAGFCMVLFGILKFLKILRVKTEVELYGMDFLKQEEPAYPSEAWELWDYPLSNGVLHWLRMTGAKLQQQVSHSVEQTRVDMSNVRHFDLKNDRTVSPLPAQNLNFAHWIVKDQLDKYLRSLTRDKCNNVRRQIC